MNWDKVIKDAASNGPAGLQVPRMIRRPELTFYDSQMQIRVTPDGTVTLAVDNPAMPYAIALVFDKLGFPSLENAVQAARSQIERGSDAVAEDRSG